MLIAVYSTFLSSVLVKVQDYEVDVSSTMVYRGNIAVLQCIIPSFMRDYLTVTSWLQDRSFHIYPSSDGGQFCFCDQFESILTVGKEFYLASKTLNFIGCVHKFQDLYYFKTKMFCNEKIRLI